ncbi:MAG: hypothetical protein KAJ10_15980, partial [Thermodesulfovibrionia bacterium]|nr:hypothetical protein [Thermodesulfovibrionia bacterium]
MTIEQDIIDERLLSSQSDLNEQALKDSSALVKQYLSEVKSYEKQIEGLESTAELEEIISSISETLSTPVAESFVVAGKTALVDTAAILSWDGMYDGFNPVKVSRNQLKGLAIAEKFDGKTLTANLDIAAGQQARKIIKAGRIEGKSIQSMTAQIYDALGGTTSRRNIETLSRTYTGTASGYARELTYKENDDIIKGYRLSATLENGNVRTGRGTCPRCAALDQQEYKKSESRPRTPFHPNCRCVFLPITLSWEEMGLDAPEMEEAYRPWTERANSRVKKE